MIYATFFYRDLRNAARGILMGRNIRSAPTLFSNTDLPAYAVGHHQVCLYAKRGGRT
jgi:hypothetical protein